MQTKLRHFGLYLRKLVMTRPIKSRACNDMDLLHFQRSDQFLTRSWRKDSLKGFRSFASQLKLCCVPYTFEACTGYLFPTSVAWLRYAAVSSMSPSRSFVCTELQLQHLLCRFVWLMQFYSTFFMFSGPTRQRRVKYPVFSPSVPIDGSQACSGLVRCYWPEVFCLAWARNLIDTLRCLFDQAARRPAARGVVSVSAAVHTSFCDNSNIIKLYSRISDTGTPSLHGMFH